LTIRTSIIGRELSTTNGLVEWFLSNAGKTVKGFKKAIYTGLSTIALAEIIADVIENRPELSGLYQVSSDPIDKYSLLCLIRDIFGLNIDILPDEDFVIDRSLDSSRFRKEAGFVPPTWPDMIKQMADDQTPYDKWRNS
jgi:dTDP-4-dehydrorhamnose reductase